MLTRRHYLTMARLWWFSCCFIILVGQPLQSSESTSRTPHGASNSSCEATIPPTTPYTEKDRFHDYLERTYEAQAFVGPVLGAAWGQGWNDPSEWRQGLAGYSRRLGSGYARSVISNSIRFGVGAVDHDDPRYYPSSAKRIWPRAVHAVIQAFIVHTRSGAPRIAISALAGSYGAAFISNAWYPASEADVRDALLRGSTAMLTSVGSDVLREFWPGFRKIFP